jgi:hypothetical protein
MEGLVPLEAYRVRFSRWLFSVERPTILPKSFPFLITDY